MTLASNYPNGFANGVTIRGVPITITNPGAVFWVSNSTTLLQGQRGGCQYPDHGGKCHRA